MNNDPLYKMMVNGTNEQRRYIVCFDLDTPKDIIFDKFEYFTRFFFPKFFKDKDAPFHKKMVQKYIELYIGEAINDEFLNIGFRGCSKTTYRKLFKAFVIACDNDHRRKYHKFLSADGVNGTQFVTDVYNMLIGKKIKAVFPEIFEKTDTKREETKSSFTTSYGVKMRCSTVGVIQRGNVQGEEEATRPDDIDFDDFESKDSLRSAVKTMAIWDNMEEAVNGLAHGGTTCYLGNYISERGNVHRLVERVTNKMIIPIWDDNEVPTWDRYTREEILKIKAKVDDFEGEYLCKPSASKDVLFDREAVDRQKPKNPLRESATFRIYKEYVPSHRIGAGADVAGGFGLDSSTSCFIDFSVIPAQVVGTYNNNTIKPDQFGHELARQGAIFGECIIGPENNKFDECIGILKLVYPEHRIYMSQNLGSKIKFTTPTSYGWNTNGLTKTKMMNDLATAVEEGLLELNDEALIREARSYTRNDVMDRDVDPRLVTRHFDLLTACAIAWQMKDFAVASSARKTVSAIDRLFINKRRSGGAESWE